MCLSDDAEKNFCPCCRTRSPIAFSFSGRPYCQCPSCHLLFAKQKESPGSVLNYYRNGYFRDHIEDQLSGQRGDIYHRLLNLLSRRQKIGSLLDVGCGCGFFLREAKSRGWKVSGVDPSQKSIEYARAMVGDVVLCGTLDDIPANRCFDAITMINVLDHMVDAHEQLQKAIGLLADHGTLYLRFPNGLFHSFFMRLSQQGLPLGFIKSFLIFHEYSLTPQVIKRWLEELGLTRVLVLNAPLTGGQWSAGEGTFTRLLGKALKVLVWVGVKGLERISLRHWVWGPSLLVIAQKK